ncbi:hypothetical protein SNEBB_010245 [Seison nebaliae]|nr:hypothetical protein SNEBB_010245 [Seison nebaliae]
MKVFVRRFDGATHYLETEPFSQICDIASNPSVNLSYNGRPLNQSMTFNDYEIPNNATLDENLELLGGIIEPTLRILAQKYNCDKMICRSCYARLHPRAVNCRKRKCGHSNDLRPKKKLK